MTIEYTAKVDSCTGVYFMRRNEPGEVFLINHIIRDADVPDFCEAMMTLAGHEWPVKREPPSIEAAKRRAEREAAERIIARLEKYRAGHHLIQGDFTDGLVAAYQTAEQLVREECGVAE